MDEVTGPKTAIVAIGNAEIKKLSVQSLIELNNQKGGGIAPLF